MNKKSHGGNTVSAVWKITQPIASKLGVSIWDIQFVKEGAQWYLRIFIDKPDGVTIDDCENMSRAIDKPLDDYDLISQSYCLEVSSPGIERELKRPEHFEMFNNYSVIVKTIRPIDNKVKEFIAVLKGLNNGIVKLLLEDNNEIELEKKNIAYIKLNDFND